MSPELLSLKQAAGYLGVSPLTVRRHISSGQIPGFTLGSKLIRVKREDLEAFLKPIPTAKV